MTNYIQADTVLPFFSDLHGGSPVGLMNPAKEWQLQSVNVWANSLQRMIWMQYDEACTLIGDRRKHKRLVPVFVGDATEGIHHGNKQVITARMSEHEEIAEDAIDYGLTAMRFGDSEHDRFYMVAGTDSHVEESEERIAKSFVKANTDTPLAVPYMPAKDRVTRWCWPMLPLEINGVLGFIAHHGPGPGQGANEGNPLRNKIKNLVVSRALRGMSIPRYVVFAHRHARQHVPFEFDGIKVDGFILPSFQGKTDWFYSVDPFAINNIGMLQIEISAGGAFAWEWLTMNLTDYQEKVERL